jgi:hypothetical protein
MYLFKLKELLIQIELGGDLEVEGDYSSNIGEKEF